jgi:hypothetical protein
MGHVLLCKVAKSPVTASQFTHLVQFQGTELDTGNTTAEIEYINPLKTKRICFI